ncbi:MAG: PilZ domain-containing protein [Gammaproteobacteria bacterium]|nr:PilZ domain-containing protein [Gammaproteobacteria bacterium]
MTEQHSDRRRFDRIATDKPVVVVDGDGEHAGTVVDISLRGALLELDNGWRPALGDAVNARIAIDDSDNCCIYAEGEVAHLEGNRIGLHCLIMDLESASNLRRLVELNLADAELLERNLAELINA